MSGTRGLRYTNVAILLHWAIAALILFNLATGLSFAYVPDAVADALVPIHISSGITVLALTLVRIAWRLTHRPPPLLPMARWERALAGTNHVLLYIAMIALPMTGWAMISAHPSAPPAPVPGAPAGTAAPNPTPHQTLIWGMLPLPKLAPIAKLGEGPGGEARLHETHEAFEARHYYGGLALLALFLLHVTGALKHQFVDRRRELGRMGVGRTEAAT